MPTPFLQWAQSLSKNTVLYHQGNRPYPHYSPGLIECPTHYDSLSVLQPVLSSQTWHSSRPWRGSSGPMCVSWIARWKLLTWHHLNAKHMAYSQRPAKMPQISFLVGFFFWVLAHEWRMKANQPCSRYWFAKNETRLNRLRAHIPSY